MDVGRPHSDDLHNGSHSVMSGEGPRWNGARTRARTEAGSRSIRTNAPRRSSNLPALRGELMSGGLVRTDFGVRPCCATVRKLRYVTCG